MTTPSTGAIRRVRRIVAQNRTPVLVGALAAMNVVRLGSNLVLTRLLAPEAFGVVGLMATISFVFQLLTDMGFDAFVVRSRKGEERRFLNVIWTIRLLRGIALATVMFIGAGALAAAFDKPVLEAPLRAASLLFIVEGLRSTHQIVAQRQQRVSYVAVIEFVAFALQTIVTLVAAYYLRSFWAIVVGMYAGALINLIFSYTLFPGGLHRIAYDREDARELWRFARLVIASSTITIILAQADKIFIGRALTLEALGLYMLAVNLTGAAITLVQKYTGRVLYPLFAQTYRTAPETLPAVYYQSRRRLTLILSFLLGAGFGGGHFIVRLLLDDRYLGAGVYVSLLCLGPLFLLSNKAAEGYAISVGRVRSALESNIVRLVWIALAAPLGYHVFGVIGLVAAFALIEAAAALYWWRRLRLFGALDWREELRFLSVAAIGGSLGICVDWFSDHLVNTGWLPAF